MELTGHIELALDDDQFAVAFDQRLGQSSVSELSDGADYAEESYVDDKVIDLENTIQEVELRLSERIMALEEGKKVETAEKEEEETAEKEEKIDFVGVGVAGACDAPCPQRYGWHCTRAEGHSGVHAAGTSVLRPALFTWNQTTEDSTPVQPLVKILNDIEEFLLTADQEDRRGLWDILTALRGPDDRQVQVKKHITTARIRTLAFPRLQRAPFKVLADFSVKKVAPEVPDIDSDDWSKNSHFYHHVQNAVNALKRIGRIEA